MGKFKFDPDAIQKAVQSSYSIAGTLRLLGLRAAGGNYATIKRLILAWHVDVAHWTGSGHRKGSKIPVVPARPLIELLRRDGPTNTDKLRKRLIREGLFQPLCSNCGFATWLGKPIPLELDHRDGDRNNQELENLRLLCPNCHALTPTYRGRNRRGRSSAKLLPPGTSAIMFPAARVAKLVDARDLPKLSAAAETPQMDPVKFGESPGARSEPTPSQASKRKV